MSRDACKTPSDPHGGPPCNAWCDGGQHVDLTYASVHRPAAEATAHFRATAAVWYPQIRVVSVMPVAEAPPCIERYPEFPTAAELPYAYRVTYTFHKAREAS